MGWLVGHFVGDFLLQNDWLAKEKKNSDIVCALHVFIYTTMVMLFTGWSNHDLAPHIFLMIAIPHFLIDRGQFVSKYMDFMGQDEFKKHLAPWSMIWVDQSFHFLCLYLVSLLIGV